MQSVSDAGQQTAGIFCTGVGSFAVFDSSSGSREKLAQVAVIFCEPILFGVRTRMAGEVGTAHSVSGFGVQRSGSGATGFRAGAGC